MDPMSSGFTQFRYESSVGVPSMMNSGSLFWNELTPRILTVLRDPGEPPASIVTPATRPSSFCSTLADVCRVTLPRSTVATEPVMSVRFCVW